MSAQSDELLEKIIKVAILAGWEIAGPQSLEDWLISELAALKNLRPAFQRMQSDIIRLAVANRGKSTP